MNKVFKNRRVSGRGTVTACFRTLGVLALFISGFAGLIVATGSSAEAATAVAPWRIEQTTSSPVTISSISCPTANQCFAVGPYTGQNSIYPAVYETGNGGFTWTDISSSIPTTIASIFGISCVSSNFCEAVGYQANASTDIEMGAAITWNGSTWSSQSVPAGVQGISSVSCMSPTFCQAGSIGTFLLWNGTTWTSENQNGIPSAETIDSLSCVSKSFCEAVGSIADQNDNSSFIWNGTTWQYQASIPNLASTTVLNSISCVSSAFCEAVGYIQTSQGDSSGISFLLNGGTWTEQSVPPNTGYLWAVSCVSANYCEAVGGNPFSVNANPSVALIWDGSSWTDQALPSGIDMVQAVTCLSSTFCEAAGDNFPGIVFLTTLPATPTIASLTPDSSPLAGGSTVTISGAFLSGVTGVNFGSTPATNVKSVSSTEVTATIPPATNPGLVEVTVQASGKTSAGSGFMYVTSGIPYTPVTPYRIADTRCSQNPRPYFCSSENLPSANQSLSAPPMGSSITVQVTGTGSGSNSVPSNAQSVIVTVTAIASTTSQRGYLTVYPTGTNPPTTSSLNYTPDAIIPNLVTATLGSGGAINILSSSANVNIVVDVEGYYGPSTSTTTNKFTPLPLPIRVLDTRCTMSPPPAGISNSYCSSLPSANNQVSAPNSKGFIKVQIAGVGGPSGVPSSGVTAVSLVVTAADSSSSGFLTVFPAGASTTPPETSNVNFAAATSDANSVTVKLPASGAVYIYNSANTPTNIVVDVNGYFSSTGDVLTPSSPVRICDTRSPNSIGGLDDVASGVLGQCDNSGTPLNPSSGPAIIQVTGIAGVPTTADAVVANVTVMGGNSSGYLTVWGAGNAQPTTSNVNWTSGQIVPNMVVSALNSNGQIAVYASSTANIIIDVVGWYSSGA